MSAYATCHSACDALVAIHSHCLDACNVQSSVVSCVCAADSSYHFFDSVTSGNIVSAITLHDDVISSGALAVLSNAQISSAM